MYLIRFLIIKIPIFEWCMVGCESKNSPKRRVLKSDWTVHSNFVNHFRRNSQHKWGGIYDQSLIKRIFTLTMKRIMRSENHEESGCGQDLDLLNISHTLCY